MLPYGAKVVRVDGDLSQATRMCSRMLESKRWMESGGSNPYRIAAKRLVAYEIVAQMPE